MFVIGREVDMEHLDAVYDKSKLSPNLCILLMPMTRLQKGGLLSLLVTFDLCL